MGYHLPFVYIKNIGAILNASIFVIPHIYFILKSCGSPYKIHTDCISFISAVHIPAQVTIISNLQEFSIFLAQSLFIYNPFSTLRPEVTFVKYKSEYANLLHKTLCDFPVL